jgi:uncharacterized membrane protein YraQ (UPF0718 family)
LLCTATNKIFILTSLREDEGSWLALWLFIATAQIARTTISSTTLPIP